MLGAGLGLLLAFSTPPASLAEDMGEVVEIREEGWPIPDLESATRQGRRWLDMTPDIEAEETKAVGYVGKNFPLFVVWSIDGEIFAIIVDEDGRGPFEYGLWDMDGDRKFETKTGPYRMIRAPRWVVEKFYKRRGLVPPGEEPRKTHTDPPSGESRPGGAE